MTKNLVTASLSTENVLKFMKIPEKATPNKKQSLSHKGIEAHSGN